MTPDDAFLAAIIDNPMTSCGPSRRAVEEHGHPRGPI